MDTERLADVAVPIFGEDRVIVEPFLPDAVEQAIALAEEDEGAPLGRRCRHHGLGRHGGRCPIAFRKGTGMTDEPATGAGSPRRPTTRGRACAASCLAC